MGGTIPRTHVLEPASDRLVQRFAHMGVIPVGVTTIFVLSLFFSILFIGSLSLAFVGSKEPHPFKPLLNKISQQEPGVRGVSSLDVTRS